MIFQRGDTCYILENNMRTRAAKIISRQGSFYTIQLVGTCGAIRLKESRLFKTEEEANSSRKNNKEEDNHNPSIKWEMSSNPQEW